MTYHKPRYRFLYLAALLLALQYASTVYINSSFLGTHFDANTVSNLYIVGAALTVICLVSSGRFLKRFGNWKLVLSGIIIEIIALLALAFAENTLFIKLAFIAHQALPPLLLFGLDIFFEGTLATKADAEKVRSYYLTVVNTAFVIAPLGVGFLLEKTSFSSVFMLSALFLGILWITVFDTFKHVHPKNYRETEIIPNIKKFLHRKSLADIFFLNFLLQCFYAVMVIFMAPYLHNVVGFSWEVIGLVYTIMLLPFVIFEAPLGRLFDRYHDEKDVLIAGFIVMSAATGIMAFTHSTSIVFWAALLFLSRIGASFVEVASEASFFKRVTDQDAGFISLFKLTVPVAYVFTPFVAGLVVPAMPVTVLFIMLSLILVVGMTAAYASPL